MFSYDDFDFKNSYLEKASAFKLASLYEVGITHSLLLTLQLPNTIDIVDNALPVSELLKNNVITFPELIELSPPVRQEIFKNHFIITQLSKKNIASISDFLALPASFRKETFVNAQALISLVTSQLISSLDELTDVLSLPVSLRQEVSDHAPNRSYDAIYKLFTETNVNFSG